LESVRTESYCFDFTSNDSAVSYYWQYENAIFEKNHCFWRFILKIKKRLSK